MYAGLLQDSFLICTAMPLASQFGVVLSMINYNFYELTISISHTSAVILHFISKSECERAVFFTALGSSNFTRKSKSRQALQLDEVQ